MKMSSNKAFILLGLLLVSITLVVSTALAETSLGDNKNLDAGGEKSSSEASVGPQRSCRCCRWGPHRICRGYCCKTPNGYDMFIDIDTVNEAAEESNPLHDDQIQDGHRGGSHGGSKSGGRHGGGKKGGAGGGKEDKP